MKTLADYERAIAIVRNVIHRWDPYELLSACRCPKDEFDHEIAKLVTRIPRIRSESDTVLAISQVFSASFNPSDFQIADCEKVGSELYSALMAEGLLEG
jgi:hypothetical protein